MNSVGVAHEIQLRQGPRTQSFVRVTWFAEKSSSQSHNSVKVVIKFFSFCLTKTQNSGVVIVTEESLKISPSGELKLKFVSPKFRAI